MPGCGGPSELISLAVSCRILLTDRASRRYLPAVGPLPEASRISAGVQRMNYERQKRNGFLLVQNTSDPPVILDIIFTWWHRTVLHKNTQGLRATEAHFQVPQPCSGSASLRHPGRRFVELSASRQLRPSWLSAHTDREDAEPAPYIPRQPSCLSHLHGQSFTVDPDGHKFAAAGRYRRGGGRWGGPPITASRERAYLLAVLHLHAGT